MLKLDDYPIFQKDIQVAITNAQLESSDDAEKLQKYSVSFIKSHCRFL